MNKQDLVSNECELKFKLSGDLNSFLNGKDYTKLEITQTYLNLKDIPTLNFVKTLVNVDINLFSECRVRVMDNSQSVITLKSSGDLERRELEKQIPITSVNQLNNLSCLGKISKTRYDINIFDSVVVSIDNYRDRNLTIAEVEFDKTKIDEKDLEMFIKKYFKDFEVENVTFDKSYKNSSLAK